MVVIEAGAEREGAPWVYGYVNGTGDGVSLSIDRAKKFATMGDAASWLAEPSNVAPFAERAFELTPYDQDATYGADVIRANERGGP